MELKEPTQVEQLAEQVARLSARIADLEGRGGGRPGEGVASPWSPAQCWRSRSAG